MGAKAVTGMAVNSGELVVRRSRGKSKDKNWRRAKDAPTAVIRLELDLTDRRLRHRVLAMFTAEFHLRRALQKMARSRVEAYCRAHRLRERVGLNKTQARFGLSRKAFEQASSEFVDRSRWLRRHLTKALAMHLADEVWETVDRHLFSDASGRRHGRPRTGGWFDSTRIPGRARSHTKDRVWESFRLVGTLNGHRAAFPARHPARALQQPQCMPAPPEPSVGGWWEHAGQLAVVFTGCGSDLILPVRLPESPDAQARLEHFLSKPQLWHKIDLARVQDRHAPGGWRVYAHLMVLGGGWISPEHAAARAAAPRDRVGGVDGNVSNLSVFSMPADPDTPAGLAGDQFRLTAQQRTAANQAAVNARRRQRALDRSRRNTNAGQYQPSKRQQSRADRRAAAGLPPKIIDTPGGARVADKAGRPKRAYWRDQLSGGYRTTRAQHAAASRSGSQAKHYRAADTARQIVAAHGPNLVVEHTNIRAWARLWGRGIELFSPGMLIAALKAECGTAGGRLLRAGTRQTALSQQCRCGLRQKKPLSQRTHSCPLCGLVGDRDLVSAAMATCVRLTDPDNPVTASIDEHVQAALAARLNVPGQREALTRSTAPTPAGSRSHAAVTAAARCRKATSGLCRAKEPTTRGPAVEPNAALWRQGHVAEPTASNPITGGWAGL
ncbi:zinc ribbon domain-containing protein [Actinoplanes sp. CA-030573]|uniref:zinc ribbon domain-containing protein n=1 Tax=Actinoplanes sp. CA-030573 TaxID=3239898 RepID=UPI003D918931